MGDKSNIEWTDATWNVITGCSVVSPGCTNCYAMRQAGTRLRHTPSYEGLTEDSKAGPVWNGKVRFNPKQARLPLQWKRPRRIFVNSMGDLFHEHCPRQWIEAVFDVMEAAGQHQFQVLTKRPERMQQFCSAWKGGKVLPNVWLGISAEDQRRADERIPPLLDTPAAVRWVSAEPLLGPIDFGYFTRSHGDPYQPILNWVVVGGESGPNARPMNPEWARSIRDQCAAAGVPFHFKQWGEFVEGYVRVGKHAAGRTLDGVVHDGYPA